MSDNKRGLYRKFEVKRTDGSSEPGGKHDDCAYFVLDLEHDEFALAALKAYARAAKKQYPALAKDIADIIKAQADKDAARCHCREVGCAHSLGQAMTQSASEAAISKMREELVKR
jgi:hypothetical protein